MPLFSSVFCAYHIAQHGWQHLLRCLSQLCAVAWKRLPLFHLQFHMQAVQIPCYASITWFIFSVMFSIFPFSSPLLCAALIGLFMLTLPYASFIYFCFLHSVAEDYCLGSIMLNASVPKRSQQLMTWFTFHPGNCSSWKALSGQESMIVPGIPAGSWTLLFTCPERTRLPHLGLDTMGREWPAWSCQLGREEWGVSWVRVLVAPSGPAQSC